MQEQKKKQVKKEASHAICPLTKKCGGCEYQGVPYEEQLKKKKKQVAKLLKPYCEVKGILGMENP